MYRRNCWLPRGFRETLAQHDPFLFQLADTLLVGRDRQIRLDNPLQQLFNVAVDLGELRLDRFVFRACIRQQAIPPFTQHALGDGEHLLVWLDGVEQFLEVAFDDIAPDRLAVARAAPFGTQVVGIAPAMAARPAAGEGRRAIVAEHMPAQHEIFVAIGPTDRRTLAIKLVLNAFEGPEGDKAFMPAFAQRDVPLGRFDIAGIEGIAQKLGDALVANDAARVLREQRVFLKVAHHIGLGAEAIGTETFEGFLDDRGGRLVVHEHATPALFADIFVTHRSLERPKTVQQPRAHATESLLRILLAKMLREGRVDILDHDGVGVVLELHLGTHQPAAGLTQQVAQVPVTTNVAGEAVNRVDDDVELGLGVIEEKLQHGIEARTVRVAAGHAVREHHLDIETSMPRIFAADGFLRTQAIAALAALVLAHASIEDCRCQFLAGHDASLSPVADGVSLLAE